MKGDPSKPGWKEKAVKGISTPKAATRTRGTKKYLSITSNVPWQFKALLSMAAKRRGISISGYIRRALAAFIAQDLEMEYEDVLKELPFPAPFGMQGAQWLHDDLNPQDHDTGEGYGDWKNLAL